MELLKQLEPSQTCAKTQIEPSLKRLVTYISAFTFAGQGVNELQTAGWMGVTPLPFLP